MRNVVVASLGLIVVIVLTAVLVSRLVGTDDGEVTVSPTSTATSTPIASATATAAATPSATAGISVAPRATRTTAPPARTGAARSQEELADRLGAALESSDWVALERLIWPSIWQAGWWGSEATPPMTPAEAVAWLKQGAQNERLDVTVTEQPVRTDRNEPYITSVWRNFDSRSGGRVPSQDAFLVLRPASDGAWYWHLAIYNPYDMPDGP